MASYYRAHFPPPSFGGGYSRNEYQNNYGMREGPSMMRNYNDNNQAPFQRYPGPGHHFQGRHQYPGNERMSGPGPFRHRAPVGLGNNRMQSSGGSMYRQPFGGNNYFQNNSSPRFHGSKERFFVPWNHRPVPSFRPRVPIRNNPRMPASDQKASNKPTDNRPKKKKNKKKKYNPRPREDAKKLKPWMTDEIYDEVKKKNELYVRAKNEDKPELWQEFKLLRNRVSSMIKEAKLKGGFMTRRLKEEDDVDKPVSCDNCDRAFATETELEEHKKEHVQCGRDGCTFEAHPKVIELHVKMLHDTGYAEAIFKLQDSEEVVKWRNERKRRYPTSENIEKHKAELAERVARGEVVETQQFGKFKRRRHDSPRNSRFPRHRGKGRSSAGGTARRWSGRALGHHCWPVAPQPDVVGLDSDSDDDSHITIPSFPGIHAIENSGSQTTIAMTSQQDSVIVNSTVSEQPPSQSSSHVLPCHSFNLSSELESSGTGGEELINEKPFVEVQPDSVEASQTSDAGDVPEILQNDSSNKEPSEPFTECAAGVKETGVSSSHTDIVKDCEKPSLKPSSDICITANYSSSVSSDKNENGTDSEGPSVVPILKSVDADAPSTICSERNENAVSGCANKENAAGYKFQHPPRNARQNRSPFQQEMHNPFDHTRLSLKAKKFFPQPPFPSGLKKHNLLDKLLANEIRHERNAIMQCVRYIVENNFFDKKANVGRQ